MQESFFLSPQCKLGSPASGLTEEANRSTQQLASSLTQSNISTISQWLDSKTKIVQASIDSFNQNAEPTAALAQAIASGDFDLVYAGTRQGDMITGTPVDFPAGYDPRQRPWYKDATAANGLVVTTPYNDASSGNWLSPLLSHLMLK